MRSIMYIAVVLVFAELFATYAGQAVPPQLTPAERLAIFGTVAWNAVPHYDEATVEKVHVSGSRVKGQKDSGSPGNLQYRVTAFGQTVTLDLQPSRNIVAPGCTVHHYQANDSRMLSPCIVNQSQCLYTGVNDNSSDVTAAVSVCGGLKGVITLYNSTLVIEATRHKQRNDTRHIVYEYVRDSQNCSTPGGPRKHDTHIVRPPRSVTGRYIEATVVVDQSMIDFHGDNLQEFILNIMNLASERFQDPSIGQTMWLTINDIIILDAKSTDLVVSSNARSTLDNFCEWQLSQNTFHNPDCMLLITRVNLAGRNNTDFSLVGLARTRGMCNLSRKCAVIQDTGLGTGFSIAHEIGHLLGMAHDGDNECPADVNIMSPTGVTGPDAIKWSACSARELRAFFSENSTASSCLLNEPYRKQDPWVRTLLGTIYTVEQQCKLILDKTATVCPPEIQARDLRNATKAEDMCSHLYCQTDRKPDTCIRSSSSRMDGTDCNNTRNWCISGRCVAMGTNASLPVDGVWTEWIPEFSTCSRSCGGGVKVERRRWCNNPPPQYGGKVCQGAAIDAVLCNMQPCNSDFRTEQCDGRFNTTSGRLVFNSNALGSCKLNCIDWATAIAHASNEHLKDGTECTSGARQGVARCVGGECRSFGCDGHLDSGFMFDHCGVCNGTGSTCVPVKGSFNQPTHVSAFETVLVIPKNSTGIIVKQLSRFCHTNVQINGRQVLGAGTPATGFYHHRDVEVNYRRAVPKLGKPEVMEIAGPLPVDVEIQVFQRYDDKVYQPVVLPNITYTYYVPVGNQPVLILYSWAVMGATSCSASCGGGFRTPVTKCVDRTLSEVGEYHCDLKGKPVEFPEPCGMRPCPASWRNGRWSSCSLTCGDGVQSRSVDCVQKGSDGLLKNVTDQTCKGEQMPAKHRTCTNEVCPVSIPVSVSEHDQNCKDEIENCASYTLGFCTNPDYKAWANSHCKKYCGYCEHDQNCKDEIENCASYTPGFCTNPDYKAWANSHCKKYCGYCGNSPPTTTVASAVDPNCADTVNCAEYVSDVCTKFASWSSTHCKKFCGQCNTNKQQPGFGCWTNSHCTGSTFSCYCLDVKGGGSTAPCVDMADCAAYGDGICQHTQFATENCKKHCGLCQGHCSDKYPSCDLYAPDYCRDPEYIAYMTLNCPHYCGHCS